MDWLLSINRFDLRARYGLASGSSSSGDSPIWHYLRNFTSQLRGTGRRRRVALEQFNPADGGELTSKEKEAAFDISSGGAWMWMMRLSCSWTINPSMRTYSYGFCAGAAIPTN